MKLQPREQSIIGFAAIAGVLMMGWFYGIDPQLKNFKEKSAQRATAQQTFDANVATITTLQQQKQSLQGTQAEMPKDKEIGKIDFQAGETMESSKRDLLDTVIEMSQKDLGNELIYVKPLPPPPEPVQQIDPNADPNAPPPLRLSDFVAEIPYEIAIRGNYVSINQFVNELSSYPLIIEIASVEVSPEKRGQDFADPTKPLRAVFKLNFLIKKT
jgi:hypothetical protein